MSSISIVCDVVVLPEGETRPLEFAVIPRVREIVVLPPQGLSDAVRCEIVAVDHWPNEAFARHSAKVVLTVRPLKGPGSRKARQRRGTAST
jgi:hypothetical protein